MSEVERKRGELELAELGEKLEDAREKMHAARDDPAAVAAYKEAGTAMANARSAFREQYQVEPGPDDAAPAVETVKVKAGVKNK